MPYNNSHYGRNPTTDKKPFIYDRRYFFSLIPIYFIGGYLRKYSSDFDEKRRKYVIIFVLAILSMVASILAIDTVNKFLGTNIGWDYLLTQNSPLQMVVAVSLFLIARNTNITYNRLVNSVAELSFSVYLLKLPTPKITMKP
ncbi:acyltransferase family protein [Lactobacillus delbrueckii]|uniref:acyltransferase family protein n=1 Tax=Lactobacillus delbrueckii TaxID=1584 RepID=UPI003B635CF2